MDIKELQTYGRLLVEKREELLTESTRAVPAAGGVEGDPVTKQMRKSKRNSRFSCTVPTDDLCELSKRR